MMKGGGKTKKYMAKGGTMGGKKKMSKGGAMGGKRTMMMSGGGRTKGAAAGGKKMSVKDLRLAASKLGYIIKKKA